jgi:uncharacterized protein YjbI with pentapeptide repeats
VEAWNRWRIRHPDEEPALDGLNLSAMDLRGADLKRANFAGAVLAGADLSRVNLKGANLTGANLEGANLSEADLSNALLDGANLTRAELTGANLENCQGLAAAQIRAAHHWKAAAFGSEIRSELGTGYRLWHAIRGQ